MPSQPANAPSAPRFFFERHGVLLASTTLIAALAFAYSNTFSVPFLFDDVAAITQNPSIEQFTTVLSPPPELSVTGRPLVNLSLAVNHAISGRAVWSYHALNLALHAACALVLFGLIRRAFAAIESPLERGLASVALAEEAGAQRRGVFVGEPSASIAFAAAALWSLHPLHTSAVTYVMQRTELLVSLCYLLTLYAFARATQCHLLSDTSHGPPTASKPQCHLIGDIAARGAGRNRWLVLSVLACVLGMAAKEVMVTAPLAVLLFDRAFVAGSFRSALQTRPRFYAALASTWLLLAWLLLGTDSRGGSAGFSAGLPWTDYALTQLFAIPHYLRLALWPQPLVFDYGNAVIRNAALIVPGALVVLVLLAATAIALRRWPRAGFCGAVFFLLLAPSSSVVPIMTQTIAEHRVYLALAAPVALGLFALHRPFGRHALYAALPLALMFGVATSARNRDFASEFTLWRDTAAKAPANARARYNLGVMVALAGQREWALREFTTALQLDPRHDSARHALGVVLFELGRPAEALPHLEEAVRNYPRSAAAHYDLANALVQLRRLADAAAHYAEAVRLEPKHAVTRYNLGNALTQLGRYEEALVQFDEAARLAPKDESARNNAARIREYLRR